MRCDGPGDPPCVRCRTNNIACVFEKVARPAAAAMNEATTQYVLVLSSFPKIPFAFLLHYSLTRADILHDTSLLPPHRSLMVMLWIVRRLDALESQFSAMQGNMSEILGILRRNDAGSVPTPTGFGSAPGPSSTSNSRPSSSSNQSHSQSQSQSQLQTQTQVQVPSQKQVPSTGTSSSRPSSGHREYRDLPVDRAVSRQSRSNSSSGLAHVNGHGHGNGSDGYPSVYSSSTSHPRSPRTSGGDERYASNGYTASSS